MSFSGEEAGSFIDPLMGKTATFLLEDRAANLAFARAALALVTGAGRRCAVLDLDALYSSNASSILGTVPAASAREVTFSVPDPESRVERELPHVLSLPAQVVIIDSFNTLYHLLSYGDGASSGRKLSFAVASMSYRARTDGMAVMLTMYKRGSPWRKGANPISGLSDLTASVLLQDASLSISCERGKAWPGGRYSIRTP